MLIDHTAEVLVPLFGIYGYIDSKAAYDLYVIMRVIGRITFPILAFTLVEGLYSTSNVKKYIGRLIGFAFISEIPFDLAFNHAALEFGYQNVYFTLALGLILIAFIKEKCRGEDRIGHLLSIGASIGICLLADILRTDYDWRGVFIILIMYFVYNKRSLLVKAICIFSSFVPLLEGNIQLGIILAIPLILMYDREKKEKSHSKVKKYFYYWFYPLHLLVLVLLRYVLFNQV